MGILILVSCAILLQVTINCQTAVNNKNKHKTTYAEGYFNAYDTNAEPEKNDVVLALNLNWNACENSKTSNGKSHSSFSTGQYYASAAAVAIEDINNNPNILPNHRLRYVWNKNETRTYCDRDTATNILLKQLRMNTMHSFLGFPYNCGVPASLASATNLPLFTLNCPEVDLAKKDEYPTFVRIETLKSDMIYTTLRFLKEYNWRKIAVIFESTWTSVYDSFVKESHQDTSEQALLEITLTANFPKTATKVKTVVVSKFDNFLNDFPKKTNIVVLMMSKEFMQLFMLMAAKKNLTNGDYVFIAVHPFQASALLLSSTLTISNYIWTMPWSQEIKEITKSKEQYFFDTKPMVEKALQSLFVLMPKIPAIADKEQKVFEKFRDRVRQGISTEPFNSDVYKSKYGKNTKPPPEAHQLYDAVMLYALGLNKTIAKGYDIRNGTDIIQNIKNTDHQSINGAQFSVNCRADVQGSFEVMQFQFGGNRTKDNYWLPKPVLSFESGKKRKSTSCHDRENARNIFVLKNATEGYQLKWLLGKQPTDTPVKKVPLQNSSSKLVLTVLAIVLAVFFFILFIIPFSLYRNHHLKKKLNVQPWKIHAGELFYRDLTVSTSSLDSLVSLDGSMQSVPTSQQDITIAYYKGMLVAVKKINRKYLELNKTVLTELKQLADVRNENLNPFIGACVQPNNILIVSAYASRRSLQDVLQDNVLPLDASFILSLIHDIIKGMLHLHSSDIKFHGNLKSSNCVIDSRWVLKITDFGLNTFRSKRDSVISSEKSELCENLLWKAPELLRSNTTLQWKDMQKADVYSFAIILQECHTRDGAWGSYDDLKEIIKKVTNESRPPFRPPVQQLIDGAEGLRDTMKKCWEEIPDKRPSFSEVRKEVDVMMKANGMCANLVENMINMLEKYSKNLEEVVAERTSSLQDEKHKVESLLERMLPKSVARQLMKGKQVEAESFKNVTIYFSDIVGFTTICSSISPMEVVNLLNTLYTMFDNIANDYDVYKVETIGDAYMVVSGLPIRNKNQHAKEICMLALDILENIKSFKIQPNDEPLIIRIGIHTGPVVAGVVGTTMPRYCLFGDTVNVAARMETTGEACRIHLSGETMNVLSEFEEFNTTYRGRTTVKGKGEMDTYWLDGVDEGKLKRKRTIVKRDQSTLYQQNNRNKPFSRLISREPSLRPRYHPSPSTAEIPSLSSTATSKERRIIDYFKSLKFSCKKVARTQVEMVDRTDTESLLHSNRSSFTTPPGAIHADKNGNELQVPTPV